MFPLDDEEDLIKYFIDHWFESKWKEYYSSEILDEINSKRISYFKLTTSLVSYSKHESINNKINHSLATQVGDINHKVPSIKYTGY